MNRAERRARDRWQPPPDVTPWDAAVNAHTEAAAAFYRLSLAMTDLCDDAHPTGITPACAEAGTRWALSAGTTLRRITADLARLETQLKQTPAA